MKTIQYAMPNYQPLPGMVDPIIVKTFLGVNTYEPLSIDDSYFMDMANFSLDEYPSLTTREGYFGLGLPIGTRVLGIGNYKDQALTAVFSDGTWRVWNGTSWNTIMSGLSTTAMCSFTNFKANNPDEWLFMANGVNGLKRYDGINAVAIGDAPADINYITTFANRLWGASGKELRGSSLNDPTNWNQFDIETFGDAASYAKTIETFRGESINMVQGGLSRLMIGMPNSLHEMYGDAPSDFSFRIITEETGIENNQSGFVHDGQFFLIHKNGIYQYGVSTEGPNRTFSDIVSDYFNSVNNTSAGTDGKKYYFQISSGVILVYDPRLLTWVVYKNIDATSFIRYQNKLHIGTAGGRVIRMEGTTDDGIAISAYAITKPFTSASAAQKMRWIKMWTFWQIPVGTTLHISFSRTESGNDWEELAVISGTNDDPVFERVIIPIRKFQFENMVRIKFETLGYAKMNEYTRQYRTLPLY